jgi:hypothetical protein
MRVRTAAAAAAAPAPPAPTPPAPAPPASASPAVMTATAAAILWGVFITGAALTGDDVVDCGINRMHGGALIGRVERLDGLLLLLELRLRHGHETPGKIRNHGRPRWECAQHWRRHVRRNKTPLLEAGRRQVRRNKGNIALWRNHRRISAFVRNDRRNDGGPKTLRLESRKPRRGRNDGPAWLRRYKAVGTSFRRARSTAAVWRRWRTC